MKLEIQLIPYIPLDAEEKGRHARIMAKGNLVLQALYDATTEACDDRLTFRVQLFKKLKSAKLPFTIFGLEVADKDIAPIREVQAIEWDVLCAHANLIKREAHKWTRRDHGTTLKFEDFYQEAVAAAVNAVYYFTKPEVKFTTFLVWSIGNSIHKALNKFNPLSHLKNSSIVLSQRFAETQRTNPEANFCELVAIMGLSHDEVNHQSVLMGKVVSEGSLRSSGQEDEDFDYTAYAREHRAEPARLEPDEREAVFNADLTDLERAVLEAYLVGGNGWQAQFANSHINPKTEKPYSRPAIKFILERALASIQRTYVAAAA